MVIVYKTDLFLRLMHDEKVKIICNLVMAMAYSSAILSSIDIAVQICCFEIDLIMALKV